MDAVKFRCAAALVGGVLLFAGAAAAAAPIGWRSDGTGAYPDAAPPTDWSEGNVAWKTMLPGKSYGSPVLADDRIFVVSDPAELLCLGRSDGRILWQRSHSLEDLYGAEMAKQATADFIRLKKEQERLHGERDKAKDDAARKAEIDKQLAAVDADMRDLMNKYPAPPEVFRQDAGNTAATPVSDGDNVFALFGNGVACAYSRGGDKLWVRFLEASQIGFGHSSSPVLTGGKLLIHLKDLIALDPRTGEELWRTPLPAQHASAVPVRVGKTDVVVSPGGAVVRVSDGRVLLRKGELGASENTPLVSDGVLYTFDDKARAWRLTPAGDDAVKAERLWETRISGGRRTPSSLLYDGLLYAVTTDGLLDVLDAQTGELAYQKRLNVGEVYASGAEAGQRIYFAGTNGEVVVVQPGKEYHETARTKVEGFGSSPVFSGRQAFLRTQKHLYCIGK
jgi:outer membrane protein assembly factor BamB